MPAPPFDPGLLASRASSSSSSVGPSARGGDVGEGWAEGSYRQPVPYGPRATGERAIEQDSKEARPREPEPRHEIREGEPLSRSRAPTNSAVCENNPTGRCESWMVAGRRAHALCHWRIDDPCEARCLACLVAAALGSLGCEAEVITGPLPVDPDEPPPEQLLSPGSSTRRPAARRGRSHRDGPQAGRPRPERPALDPQPREPGLRRRSGRSARRGRAAGRRAL